MKETIEQLERLGGAIRDAEYQFLVLEPILFYGIAIGLVGFVASYFMKADKLQIAALMVVAVSAGVFVAIIGGSANQWTRGDSMPPKTVREVTMTR